MRLALAVLVMCAGCDALFNLDHIPPLPIDASGDGDGGGSGNHIDAMIDAPHTSPIQFFQGTSNTPGTSITVFTLWPNAQKAGDLSVIFIGWTTQDTAVTSIGDNKNTYKPATSPIYLNGLGQVAYYAENIVGGSASVSITFNQQTDNIDIRMLEYSSLLTSNAFETDVSQGGIDTLMATGQLTTVRPHTLIVGGFVAAGRTTTVGNACTERILTPNGNYAEDYEMTTAGPAQLTATQDPFGAYIGQAVAFAAP